MGLYKEALKKYHEWLAIREQKLGKDHPNYSTILHNIGNIYQSMGIYEEALKFFKKCLTIRE